MSDGMLAYVRELRRRLPHVAPDITLRTVARGKNFSFTEQIEIPFASRNADVVHFPTIFAPVMLPRRYVVTIHDLIHLRYPELFSRPTGAYYSLFVRRLLNGAATIVVGDERTRTDCVSFLEVQPEWVRVVPLGYDPELAAVPPRPAERPYVLYVGNHRPHKNLGTLIAAWQSLPADIFVDLYLTGDDDLALPESHGARRLVFLGHLSARETAAAIRGALAVVQPSLCEGFGLPVLEALVRRIPVLAADEAFPAPLERFVARFSPRDVDALRALLDEVVRSPQRLRALAAEGETTARSLTWDRFALTMAAVYREVCGR
jgi:glycosyltransferase involved in cell wall biosynthesis